MSFLIKVERVKSRREFIRDAKAMLNRYPGYSCHSGSYWRWGKMYAIDVRSDGRILDSRKTLIQRLIRWLDKKDRQELASMLSDRLSKNDEARRRDVELGRRDRAAEYIYRDGVCTFKRATGLRQYE